MGGPVRPQTEVIEAVRSLLDSHLGARVEAAFVYGSVVAGTATADSDIDTFVIPRVDLPEQLSSELAAKCTQLQLDLGYRPDREHPVEIFSVRVCVEALHEVLTLRALFTAARGDVLDPMTLNSDCLEILRAMLYPRLVVIDSPILDSLTRIALGRLDRAARANGVDRHELRSRIGVKWPTAFPVRRPLEPLRCGDAE